MPERAMRCGGAILLLLAASCGPRGVTSRPGALPPDAVSGPLDLVAPPIGAAADGPHRGEPEIDPAALPRDPAALPGPVVRWQQRPSEPWPGPGPVPQAIWSPGNLVVVLDDEAGVLAARALDDGRELWSLPLPNAGRAMHQMPPVERDGVLFLAWGASVIAVDLEAGAQLWRHPTHGEPDGPAFVTGGRLALRTVFRPLEDPSDPDSIPDFDAPADTTLLALDAATGETAWSDAIAEQTQLAAGPEHVVLAEWIIPEEEEGGEGGGEADGAEESAEYFTVVSIRRLSDGGAVGSRRFSGLLGQPLAWRDRLLVPGEMVDDEGVAGATITAFALPALDPLWTVQVPEANASYWLVGGDLLLLAGSKLRRVDVATGAIAAESDVSALLPPPAHWPGGEEWRATQCIGGIAVAGNSLVYATREGCGVKQLVLLDGATLRPWRVTMGFDGPVNAVLADAATAVVELPGGLAAVDLRAVGPSLNESTTPARRLAAAAAEIERGELMRGFPLDHRAKEFVLGGEAIAPAVREALAAGTVAEQLFAATVLRHRPDPEAVDTMVAAFGPPPPVTDELGACDLDPTGPCLRMAFLGRLLEALAVCGDPRAAGTLGAVFDDGETYSEHARSLALQGLAAIGTPEALARLDAHRVARSRRTEPWRPPVVEGSAGRRFDDAGMFGGGAPAAGADGPARRTSADGKVVALTAYAAGGASDLWLLGEASGILVPLFTGVTSSYGLGIVAVEATDGGARVTVSRTAGGPNCAICALMGEMEGEGGPAATEEETLELRWEELRRDADGDGWTDLLERRLHTDPARSDSDFDGIPDAVDPAPRGKGPSDAPCNPGPPHACRVDETGRRLDDGCRLCPEERSGGCVPEQVLTAAFFADFAFVPGDVPLFVEGPHDANLQYEGYGGPVIWLSSEESDALQAEVGLDGATYFSFEQRREEGPDGEWRPVGSPLDLVEFSESGARATVNVTEYRGRLNAVGRRIELRCIERRWYPLSVEMTWIS